MMPMIAAQGRTTKAMLPRARALLARVGLNDLADRHPNALSGGQAQRVAIARSLALDPPLVLADEPTGNLDSQTTEDVLALMQALHKEQGITIVMVTHEPDVAACAERLIVVRDGLIASDTRNPAVRVVRPAGGAP